MSRWPSGLTRSQGDREGVPLGAGKSGNTGGNNSDFTRSEITSISVGYAHLRLPTKKRQKTGFKTWYAFGIPRNNELKVILPEKLPKLVKNALCLSQSALSNFGLSVIKM